MSTKTTPPPEAAPSADAPMDKIVLVAGQEFRVPTATANEAIRQQLLSLGFTDVTNAEVKTGTKTIDGTVYTTVEFVKKAGTKGAGNAAALVALLTTLPPVPLPAGPPGITRAQARLLEQLLSHELDGAAALAALPDVLTALGAAAAATEDHLGRRSATKGADLCRRCDTLSPVAAPAVAAW